MFWRDGCPMVEDAVTPAQLAALNGEIAGCRGEPGNTVHRSVRPRSMAGRASIWGPNTGHQPALRRINNPSDISDAYREVMLESRMVDMVADLIGPDVKFHHCKINLKLSGRRPRSTTIRTSPYAAHQRRHRDGASVPRRCRPEQRLPHRRAGLAQGAGALAVRRRRNSPAPSLPTRKRKPWTSRCPARQGRQRLPDAHPSSTGRPPMAPTSRAGSISASTRQPTPC